MVLKRLFVTALSALGLGAIAAGPAFSQDSIPAPKLYGDITGCKTSLTSVVDKRNKGKTDSILDTVFDAAPALITTVSGNGAALVANVTPCTATGGTTDNVVTLGFNEARLRAQAVLDARRLATADGATQDDKDAYADALAAQKAYGGAVYDEVFNEVAKRAAARSAIAKWNALFDDPTTTDNTSDGTYSLAKTAYDATVLNNLNGAYDSSPADLTTTDSRAATYKNEYGIDSIMGFQAVVGFDDAAGPTNLAAVQNNELDSAFDAKGDLVFAQNVTNTTGATNTHLDDSAAGSTAISTLGNVATNLAAWEAVKKAADKAVADADPATVSNYDLLKQRAARIGKIRDHAKAEMDRLLRVVRKANRATGTAGVTEVKVLSNYSSATASLKTAENSIRTSASALETARESVKAGLESADDYLSQVVSIEEREKQELLDLHDDDPPESQLKAANDAIAAAKKRQDTHSALVGDPDNPANALVNGLLETDEKKADDGQALVDAISSNYNTAKQASDDASAAKTRADEVASSVDGLTGEGGAVAMNTAAIETNTVGIATNKADIATNKGMIETNMAGIATNKADIATNKGMIETNMAGIATNKGMIESNTSAIGANTSAIADNANAIGSNSAAIQRNSGMIGELSESLETVRAGVAASMALAGMPAINGRGVSIGVGSFDGESAFAVGFMIQGEMASFKVGVTSAGGATGASAGVGFQF